MSNVNQIPEEFQIAWKRITALWQETTPVWDDQVRRRFEQEFWTMLEQESKHTQVAMTNLAKVLTEAQRRVQ